MQQKKDDDNPNHSHNEGMVRVEEFEWGKEF